MQKISLRENINTYIAECEKLKNELKEAIVDLEYLNSGGVIRYAVDFSEIYAHVFPDRTAEEIRLFSDDQSEFLRMLQDSALRKLFFGLPAKLILLTPYVIELENFIYRVRRGELENIITRVPYSIVEVENILQDPDFIKFSDLVTNLIEKNRSLGKRENQQIIDYLEEHAPNIISLIDPLKSPPIGRVREILEKSKFDTLRSLIDINFRYDTEFLDRWSNSLYSKRSQTSETNALGVSQRDASAMSLIAQTNRVLKEKRIRCHLVTRSKYMHRLLADEIETRSWDNETGNFLRHPRVVYLINSSDDVSETKIERLKELLDTVEQFLNAVRDEELNILQDSEPSKFVIQLLQDVKQKWRSTLSLSISLDSATQLRNNIIDEDKDLKRAYSIFQLIHNQEELRKQILNRLDELALILEREHELLTFSIISSDPIEQNILKKTLLYEKYGNKNVLRTSVDAVPYSLQFFSSPGKKLLSKLEPGKDYDWIIVLKIFKENFSEESDYERLLAMAYIYGTLRKWELSEIYCKKAISLSRENKDISPHEAFFFSAICKRKFNPTFERQVEALRYLELAIDEKQKYLCDQAYEDPRYLKELGTQVLQINNFERPKKGWKIPSTQKGLEYLIKAEKLSKDDHLLKIQCINNRLFYFVDGSHPFEKSELKNVLEELIDLQSKIEVNEALWPATVLDTIAWSKWILNETVSKSEKSDILRLFRIALKSEFLTNTDKDTITTHYEIVKQADKSI